MLTIKTYQFYASSDHNKVIADGCADIQFCCDKENVSSTVWGSVLAPQSIEFNKGRTYFGIRLSTSVSRRLTFLRYAELINKGVSLSGVNNFGSELSEKITHAISFKERILLTQKWLLDLGFFEPKKMDFIDYSINKILEDRGSLKVSDLSDYIGSSERLIRDKFTNSVGMSPKQFCRVVRFQSVIEFIVFNRSKESFSLSDLTFSSYYDESHLSKEVKYFTGLTPKQFIKETSNIVIKRNAISTTQY
ncbi:helix-turn-helix domain-containing protein [Marinomonas atlantica]|uniref:helix-turn-helix domain-containing protein n=1 Tax=Marinomonas atlantica TaxID=1806668 RepID=UPI000B22858F|nr:helix-turn-helix domain-containing protein [Marinomonas atlantica]